MSNRDGRKAKVRALAKRAGTAGEQAAAEAALERMAGPVVASRSTGGGVVHLTDAVIRRLPLPTSGHVITWDDETAGFGCRVTTAGAKSFIFNYRTKFTGQQRRITIGAVGDWSTTAARTKAKALRRIVDDGGDPRGDDEEQKEAATVADLIERFESDFLPRKRPSTVRTYRGMLKKHIKPHFGKFTKVAASPSTISTSCIAK